MPLPAKMPDATELAKRYGIEQAPESVLRLTQLVANRTSDSGDIAKVINQDKALTQRLLSAANPKAQKEADYRFTTVEDGLARIGMSWVIMLAMVEPLTRAVQKTFKTMLKVELKPSKAINLAPFQKGHILCEVAFSGKATGVVHLRLLEVGAYVAAERMLGLKPEDMESAADLDDVIGEVGNMIAGNLKSNLCDAKLECKLSPPKIVRSPSFEIFKPSGNAAERYGFQSPEIEMFVDISVNPSS
jgi:chemotaxis protein CheX